MRIGLLGAQNSHAKHFCEALNGQKKHEGFAATALYGGDDPAAAEELGAAYGLVVRATEEEVIAETDALVITYRRGSLHYGAAMKALRAGKPVFIDKPFVTRSEDAEEIIALAEEKKILLTGGTSLKSLPGLAAPAAAIRPGSTVLINFAADPASEYDGYWFYGAHAIEICVKLCGENFTAVSAFKNGNVITAAVNYPDKQCMIITAPDSSDLRITVTNNGLTEYFPLALNYQSVCPDEFATMLKTGAPPRGYSHYQKSTDLMSRIMASAGLSA